MSQIILHHYELSTFSEKVRAALGMKGLAWRSVDTPPAPPRPLLAPLTGGYRRIPVMQVGADVYCDTNIILPAIERLKPSLTFYPAGNEGVVRGLSFAWERAMWIPTIGVISHFIGDMFPAEFIKDRKEGYLGIDISKAAMAPDLPTHLQHVQAQYGWLKAALADGRKFIFGDAPSALDLTCYQTTFLMRKNCPPEVDAMVGLAPLVAWYDRVAAFGHGAPTPMSAEDAFAVAKTSAPAGVVHIKTKVDASGLQVNQRVTITPDDNARVPVTGTIVASDDHEIIIHRRDPEAGDLHIHFPRLGFNVTTD